MRKNSGYYFGVRLLCVVGDKTTTAENTLADLMERGFS